MLGSHSYRALAATAALSLAATGSPQIVGAVESAATPQSAAPRGVCGDALLAPGETCETCAADCTPRNCTPDATKRVGAQIVFTPPRESLEGDVRSFTPVAATITVAYRTNRLHLPAKGTDREVRTRISDLGSSSQSVIANDLDYALRLVVTDTKRLMPSLMSIEFDTCNDSPAPRETDFACVVEACAGHGGALADCYCSVALGAAPAK